VGHVNGFEHLSAGVGDLEAEWDLGFKFLERESDDFRIDPATGVKAWGEPFLALYVSVCRKDSGLVYSSFQYGLTRSKFSSGLSATQADRDRLLEVARPHIEAHMRKLMNGDKPASFDRFQML
jgi:hypothetical protein